MAGLNTQIVKAAAKSPDDGSVTGTLPPPTKPSVPGRGTGLPGQPKASGPGRNVSGPPQPNTLGQLANNAITALTKPGPGVSPQSRGVPSGGRMSGLADSMPKIPTTSQPAPKPAASSAPAGPGRKSAPAPDAMTAALMAPAAGKLNATIPTAQGIKNYFNKPENNRITGAIGNFLTGKSGVQAKPTASTNVSKAMANQKAAPSGPGRNVSGATGAAAPPPTGIGRSSSGSGPGRNVSGPAKASSSPAKPATTANQSVFGKGMPGGGGASKAYADSKSSGTKTASAATSTSSKSAPSGPGRNVSGPQKASAPSGPGRNVLGPTPPKQGGTPGHGKQTQGPTQTAFEQAFASARKSGAKTFDFKGKKYTTQRADDKPAAKLPSGPGRNVSGPAPKTTKIQLVNSGPMRKVTGPAPKKSFKDSKYLFDYLAQK